MVQAESAPTGADTRPTVRYTNRLVSEFRRGRRPVWPGRRRRVVADLRWLWPGPTRRVPSAMSPVTPNLDATAAEPGGV